MADLLEWWRMWQRDHFIEASLIIFGIMLIVALGLGTLFLIAAFGGAS